MSTWRGLRRWLRRLGPPPPPAPPSRGQILAKADAARDGRDWPSAARLYAEVLSISPADAPIQVQLGHALKESGDLAEAEAAYSAAIALQPTDPDAHMQLGHLLKRMGRSSEAHAAFGRALVHDPNLAAARIELISAGARRDMPENSFGQPMAASALDRIAVTLESGLDAVRHWVSVSTFPVEAYGAFRRAHPIQPPPQDAGNSPPVLVVIDARTATPAEIRTTLDGLLDQRLGRWTALVRAASDVGDHPVASHAFRDSRIRFIEPSAAALVSAAEGVADHARLSLPAGIRIDPEALGWLAHALSRTGAQAVYCDHDHHIFHWREGVQHLNPVLQPVLDRLDLATTPAPPLAVMLAPDMSSKGDNARDILLALPASARVARLPRILFSEPAGSAGPPMPVEPVVQPDAGIISVVIPTRDQPWLLTACIASLRRLAVRPEQLRIVVLDNRSETVDARVALDRIAASGEADVLAIDEPFNWSRFNDVGAESTQGEILVFVNDDTEMLTAGWDDRLRLLLASGGVAAAGARLLYPDGTLQHGGMVLGAGDGRPGHEGVGASAWERGPLDRWARDRLASAVTGAFLAVRRDAYVAAGGFDQTLAVGYSDIDLCLRLREAGGVVAYAGSIEVTHHESKTRGLNDTPAKVAWDDAELFDLYRRWGNGVLTDPSVNPQWHGRRNHPFEALRDLSLSQVLDALDASAAPHPWTVTALAADETAKLTFSG